MEPGTLTPEQLAANIAGMPANMDANIKILQAARDAGTLKVPFDVAMQNLGKAFQQRVDMHHLTVAEDPQALVEAADILGIEPIALAASASLATDQADALAGFKADETLTDESDSPVVSGQGGSLEIG